MMFEAGRTAQIAKEMRNYGLAVLWLSETRWNQAVQLTLSSEVILFSGHKEDGAAHTQFIKESSEIAGLLGSSQP